MKIFSTVVLFFITLSAFPQGVEDIGLTTDVEASFFSRGLTCDKPNIAEFNQLNECLPSYTLGGSPSDLAKFGSRVIDDSIEEIFFQELALRSHNATKCEKQLLDGYVKDPAPANALAWQAFQKVQTGLQELHKARQAKLGNNSSLNLSKDVKDFSMAEASKRSRSAHLVEEAAALETAIKEAISALPFGHHQDVREKINGLLASPSIDEKSFTAAYGAGMTSAQKKMSDAAKFFDRAFDSKDKLYTIKKSEKLAFVQSGQAEALLKSIDPKGTLDKKLGCRLRARYKDGPQTAMMASIPILIGATFYTGGVAGSGISTVRGLLGLAVQGATLTTLVTSTVNTCLKDTVNVSATDVQQCAYDMRLKSVMSEFSGLACGISAGFTAVAALAPFARYFKIPKIANKGLQPEAELRRSLAAIEQQYHAELRQAFTGKLGTVMGRVKFVHAPKSAHLQVMKSFDDALKGGKISQAESDLATMQRQLGQIESDINVGREILESGSTPAQKQLLDEMVALRSGMAENLKAADSQLRGKVAEAVIGRKLSSQQAQAVQRAHEVGAKDGARIGTYTPKHIDEKTRILKAAGFSKSERRQLLEKGVAGIYEDYQRFGIKPIGTPPTQEEIRRVREGSRNYSGSQNGGAGIPEPIARPRDTRDLTRQSHDEGIPEPSANPYDTSDVPRRIEPTSRPSQDGGEGIPEPIATPYDTRDVPRRIEPTSRPSQDRSGGIPEPIATPYDTSDVPRRIEPMSRPSQDGGEGIYEPISDGE